MKLKKNEYWAIQNKETKKYLDIDKEKQVLCGFYDGVYKVVKVRITEVKK